MNPALATDGNSLNIRNGIVGMLKALSGQSRQMVLSKPMIDMCGGIYPALIFNQILYWSDKTTDPEGWFSHSYEDWEEETTLSKYHVMQAMAILSKMGIQTKVKRSKNHKYSPTVHYRVDDAVLWEHIRDFFDHSSSKVLTLESEEISLSKSKNPSLSESEIPQQIYTKKITKKKREKESARLKIVDEPTDAPIGDSLSGDDSVAKGEALLEEAFATLKDSVSVKAEDSDSQPADSKTTEKILPRPRKPKGAAPAAAATEPAVPRLRNAMQEALAYAFKEGYGGLAGRMGGFFAGTLKDDPKHRSWFQVQPQEQPATPQEVIALALWYSKHPDYHKSFAEKSGLPKTPATLRERLDEFRGAIGYTKAMEWAGPLLERRMRGEKVRPDVASGGAPVESAQAFKRFDPKANSAYAVRTDPDDDPENPPDPTPVGAF